MIRRFPPNRIIAIATILVKIIWVGIFDEYGDEHDHLNDYNN